VRRASLRNAHIPAPPRRGTRALTGGWAGWYKEVHDGKFPGMKIAAASSADTPFAVQIGRKALTMLEVVPGVTVWDLLLREHGGEDVNQIGRTPPLSSDKSATHFPILKSPPARPPRPAPSASTPCTSREDERAAAAAGQAGSGVRQRQRGPGPRRAG
jgi:hypothetical protein